MQLEWYYVDDKDIAAKNDDFVFRLKKDTEKITVSYKERIINVFRLQVRKKQNVTFHNLGYNFLLSEIYVPTIKENYVDGLVWSEIEDIVKRTEDILFVLGYLEEETINKDEEDLSEKGPDNYEVEFDDYFDNYEKEEEFPAFWTEEKIEHYLNIGRGTGEKGQYTSWLTTSDMQNRKEVAKTTFCDWIIDDVRSVHLLGNLDILFFNSLQWNKDIIDIREYYPLDRTQTLEIAKNLKIAHQKDKTTKIPTVMVTNFLITYERQGRRYNEAVITSWSDKTHSKRFQNQLKIFRTYWNKQGIEVRLVTEKDVNLIAARNYSKFSHFKTANHYVIEQEICRGLVDRLLAYQLNTPIMTIAAFTRLVADVDNKHLGKVTAALFFLIANRIIEFPHNDIEYTDSLQIKTLEIKHTKFKIQYIKRPPRILEDTIVTFE